jgi:hypothetical protein
MTNSSKSTIKLCRCGELIFNGKTRCDTCREKTVENNRKRVERNASKGLCGCGRDKPIEGESKCQVCKDSIYNARRKFHYGITSEQYQKIIREQNYSCSICNTKFSNESKNTTAHIDHDHITNKVRGLLCGYCNCILGFSKDNTETLLNAIAYLTHHEVTNKESE